LSYRYTDKERDDSSGLYYYGARYLAPWLTRWISPDSAGAVDGLNLYVFASDNGSATIGVVVFVVEGLGFVIQLQGVGL
jgi:RHS repeat-associated protein